MSDVVRGDGRLSHDLLPGERGPQDECGVFGVWAPGEDVARLTYFGIYALQHRGQESAGIAVSNREQILVYKDMGLVSQVFDDTGPPRDAATGAWRRGRGQPTLGAAGPGTVALAHNGNLTNTRRLIEQVKERSGADLTGELGRGSSTDTAVITAKIMGDTEKFLLAALHQPAAL